jgi:hypothetical protein
MSHRRIRLLPEQRNKHGNIYRCRFCNKLCKPPVAELIDDALKTCSCSVCIERLTQGGDHE